MAHLKGFDAFYARSYRRVVGQVFALLGGPVGDRVAAQPVRTTVACPHPDRVIRPGGAMGHGFHPQRVKTRPQEGRNHGRDQCRANTSGGQFMTHLVVLGVENRDDAERLFDLAGDLAKQELLQLQDAAYAWRDDKGKVRIQQAVSLTGAGAAQGPCGAR